LLQVTASGGMGFGEYPDEFRKKSLCFWMMAINIPLQLRNRIQTARKTIQKSFIGRIISLDQVVQDLF
jgi:hypothetical protein